MIKVRTSNNLIDMHKADSYKIVTSDYGSGGDLSVLRNGKEIAFYPFGQWAAVFDETEDKSILQKVNKTMADGTPELPRINPPQAPGYAGRDEIGGSDF